MNIMETEWESGDEHGILKECYVKEGGAWQQRSSILTFGLDIG